MNYIYKYCSAELFEKIVNSHSMWMTDISESNDTSELKLVYNVVKETFVEEFDQKKPEYMDEFFNKEDFLKFYEAHTKNIDEVEMNVHTQYVSCFSQDGDMLSQWRGYADDGKGLSICFDSDKLIIDDSYTYRKVEYNLYKQKALFRPEIKRLISEIRQYVKANKTIDGYDKSKFMVAYNKLLLMGVFVKNNFFNEEHESRYCFHDFKGKDHIEILIGEEDIKQVIIGPKCTKTKAEVIDFLQREGFKGFEVEYSKGHGIYVDSANHKVAKTRFDKCIDEKAIFEKALDELSKIVDCFCQQIILNLSTSAYTYQLCVVADRMIITGLRWDIAENDGVLAAAFRNGEVINVGEVATDARFVSAFDETESELAVPIKENGNCIGVINLESEEKNYFSDDIARKVTQLANELGVILVKKEINRKKIKEIKQVRL